MKAGIVFFVLLAIAVAYDAIRGAPLPGDPSAGLRAAGAALCALIALLLWLVTGRRDDRRDSLLR